MDIKTEERDGIVILYPQGEIDIINVANVKNNIYKVIEEGKIKIILNLQDIMYVDSSAVGMIVESFFYIKGKGGDMRLCGLKNELKDILSSANLENTLHIDISEEASFKAFT
ncbi:anti-sigma factor antagonist [Spirochaetota bacterium]